jgi:electron transport complex protein RnfE
MKIWQIIKNGIIDENPAVRLVLGTCPTLAVTTSAINGFGMGISTMIVLIGGNMVIAMLRDFIPNKVRIPAYILIISGFVVLIQMLLKAYIPFLDKALGIYIPLIVANCLLLERAEVFAAKNPPIPSGFDGLGMGLGFTLALTTIGSVREVFGNGSLLGYALPWSGTLDPMLMIILPPGGFLIFGLLIGSMNVWSTHKIKQSGCQTCHSKETCGH